ncbi:MAG: PQQ-binding-like beta-propeller repeat protein [bacterium]
MKAGGRAEPAGEMLARRRFLRAAGLCLLLLVLGWAAVGLPLWYMNRHLLSGVPVLLPAEMRLAMPEAGYQVGYSSFYSPFGAASPPPVEPGRLRIMGRGLVQLREDGSVAWELALPGLTRLALPWGGSQAIRALSIDEQSGECTVSAVSPDGTLLWQLPLQAPVDSLATVDASGTLAICGSGGSCARISADGLRISRFMSGAELRTAEQLPDGRRYLVDNGLLRCWNPDFSPAWDYRPEDSVIEYAAGAGPRIVARDQRGRLHCLAADGSLLWQERLPESVATAYDGYGQRVSDYHGQDLDGFTGLFFNSSDWVVLSPQGARLWQGQGYPYFGYPGDVTAQELFAAGPGGQRLFKSGADVVRCVDSEWRELWHVECRSATEIVSSDERRIVLHESGRAISACDWSGNELWRHELRGSGSFARNVSSSGGLTLLRTLDNLLLGIADDGTERLRLQLGPLDEYNQTGDGEFVYVRCTSEELPGENWILDELRTALHISGRSYVDCYDTMGERQWRARLPQGMQIDRLRRQPDGDLAIVATPEWNFRTGYSSAYNAWEFIFRRPRGGQ